MALPATMQRLIRVLLVWWRRPLQPGQKIWVRVRGVKLGSEARWSEPIAIIVV